MSSNTPAIRQLVEIIDGQVRTNSFKIAERFGRNHKDVLKAIDALECSADFRERNFAPTSAPVPMPRGGVRQIKAYSITRDGFTFLAMGFTGSKAAQWKEAYIDAFNRMEASLQQAIIPSEALPVAIPMMLGTDMRHLAGKRFLVSFSDDGHYSAKSVPDDCVVMNIEQFIKALSDPNGMYVSSAALSDLIVYASRKLASRIRV